MIYSFLFSFVFLVTLIGADFQLSTRSNMGLLCFFLFCSVIGPEKASFLSNQ